ncbi:MAG: phosphoribosylanthranilate isomerase [Gammaproteobacteria bacterium]|nr:phosphoribosylanthranilate isomerase [Gammaproteobacteria bacterium]
MFVKICGLSTEEHVQVAVNAGADAVGFVFADSVRRIDPAHAAAITGKVSGAVKKVAVMLHPSNREWQEVLQAFTPDVLQTDAEDFADLDVPASVECWPVYREGKKVTVTFAENLKVTDTFLYEGARSGSGEAVDWAGAAKVAEHGNMILAGGLGVENVAEAINAARPFGVDVSSGVETAPGRKDSRLIRDFISAAKAAGNNL